MQISKTKIELFKTADKLFKINNFDMSFDKFAAQLTKGLNLENPGKEAITSKWADMANSWAMKNAGACGLIFEVWEPRYLESLAIVLNGSRKMDSSFTDRLIKVSGYSEDQILTYDSTRYTWTCETCGNEIDEMTALKSLQNIEKTLCSHHLVEETV